MEQKYLYVVLSATPYRIGAMIRRFTREQYNHLSLSLDEHLTPMYGFARRYYRTPLYGGFVKESLSRYCVGGKLSDIKVHRLPISEDQHRHLTELFAKMYSQKQRYLYNHLSAATACFHKRLFVKDAYTCVEFGIHILDYLGLDVDIKKYHTVGAVAQLLDEYTVYTGPIPEGAYDEDYMQPKPVPHPVWVTIRDIFALFPRWGK